MIKNLRFKSDGSFYASSNVLSNDEMDDLVSKIDILINNTIKSIENGEFNINPKVYKRKIFHVNIVILKIFVLYKKMMK